MRKKEQLLWDAMRRNMPRELDMQRVENLVGEGMPDVYVGRSGKWVELKASGRTPARPTTPLLGEKEGMRPSQKNWHLKHMSGIAPESYILIRTAERELLLLSGNSAHAVNGATLVELRCMTVCRGDWDAIAKELT